MVSSNHSFWCSAVASRTPHRRMWENSSSRACSKAVGVDILRGLAERIQALDRSGQLLERVPELQKLLGNTRSELFHYEVRLTYDTPEVAESRRIVDEAERQAREARAGFDEDEDDEPWRVPG